MGGQTVLGGCSTTQKRLPGWWTIILRWVLEFEVARTVECGVDGVVVRPRAGRSSGSRWGRRSAEGGMGRMRPLSPSDCASHRWSGTLPVERLTVRFCLAISI